MRVLAISGFKPQNTIEFHFYAAEEDELKGSKHVFDRYSDEGKSVVAMLEQDMAGISQTGALNVITDADLEHPELGTFVTAVAKAYSDKPPTTEECGGAGCISDHVSASNAGFRMS